jgi:hypothetical protein
MRLSRIDQHIKDELCARQRALLGVFSSRYSSVSRGVRSAAPIFFGLPLVVVLNLGNIGMRTMKIESVVQNMCFIESVVQSHFQSAVSAGLAFSAVTIAVPEAFLLPAAENWSPIER